MLHDHARTGSNAAAASPGWQNVHRSIVYIGYLYDIDKSSFVQLGENKRVG